MSCPSTSSHTPTVLTIAGSDPTGGAGIQADLKTMTTIGVYGAAAISCLTVQNSAGVTEVVPVETGLIRRQVQAVMSDHWVSHIKIGMVGSEEIARALAELLRDFEGEVIYDPVLTASAGQSLLQSGHRQEEKRAKAGELLHPLIARTTVLTPNGDELAQICQHNQKTIATRPEAITCAQDLLRRYEHLQAVIVKGGHIEVDSLDIHDICVFRNKEILTSRRPRINSHNLHGTGCTCASAFAAFHCLHHDYRQAFAYTASYMSGLIEKSRQVSLVKSGAHGPLFHALMRETVKA